MKNPIGTIRAGLLLLCLAASGVQANVLIGGTRVIFPAADGEVTVRLTNDNNTPALVEAWVDRGDIHSTPDKVDTPFLITPPLFRMEPHKDQSLRILATSPNLPADRESLFWLNVLEIPPKPSGAEFTGKNVMQLAIRSRLKLFYRPAKLPGDPLKAPGQVTWTVVPDGHGYALEVKNPTAYHITIIKLSLSVAGKQYNGDLGMVDPFGTLKLAVKDLAQAPGAGSAVAYDIANDYGAATSYKGNVSP